MNLSSMRNELVRIKETLAAMPIAPPENADAPEPHLSAEVELAISREIFAVDETLCAVAARIPGSPIPPNRCGWDFTEEDWILLKTSGLLTKELVRRSRALGRALDAGAQGVIAVRQADGTLDHEDTARVASAQAEGRPVLVLPAAPPRMEGIDIRISLLREAAGSRGAQRETEVAA